MTRIKSLTHNRNPNEIKGFTHRTHRSIKNRKNRKSYTEYVGNKIRKVHIEERKRAEMDRELDRYKKGLYTRPQKRGRI